MLGATTYGLQLQFWPSPERIHITANWVELPEEVMSRRNR